MIWITELSKRPRMPVRVLGDAGIVRYLARIEMTGGGQEYNGVFWHTDFYEWHDGRWQAVWSQATRVSQ